ncbi:DUF1835 domain-containing protein [Mucilaginibacter aquariorum]|uniref:DUF1835 domain-containing protein n=1 Tax=Mucilaginibacter aquariorum TaxID=2967225 RepID=A0ABT1T4V9_9SPHI|nr:DUF1835 domain-containing protein [Mucilaginibacter aquariorum]MCQ6959656.1 DUF1835 domain-containing protein [Mucilaginibacter aquariorum]
MSAILHVLNGDATLNSFEQANIGGDIIVWREVLSEGPVSENIESAAFWQERAAWITKTFNETPERYQDSMVAQLEKFSQPYDEINLWFEFDLHCQVNLLGVMMLFSQKTNLSGPAIYLICPADYPGVSDFRGMGELNGEQLEYLYDNIRVQLGEYDFELATEAWDLYIRCNAERIQQWLNETHFWANMTRLKPAMEAHLKRLQVDTDGLNYIHQKLLGIYNNGAHSRPEIYTAFWSDEKIYGMGDTELDIYLDHLNTRNLINL